MIKRLNEKKIIPSPNSSAEDRIRVTGIYIFGAILLIVGLIGLIIPLRPKTSDIEKRTLATFPEFNLKDFINGNYFSDIDTWYSDTFPMREQLISANSSLNSLYGLAGEEIHGNISTGDAIPSLPLQTSASSYASQEADSDPVPSEEQVAASTTSETTVEQECITETEQVDAENTSISESTAVSESTTIQEQTTSVPDSSVGSPYDNVEPEVNGAVYIAGNSAYNLYYFSLEKSNQYIETINHAADYLAGTADVYSILIPTSTGIMLSEEQQDALGCSSSKDAIAYMYASMNERVHTVPVYDALMQHRDEYIYFRTDHHWTALGAYYGYQAYASAAGFTPYDLSVFEVREFPGFLGTYYASSGQSAALSATPDTVYAYMPLATNSLTFYDPSLNPTKWFVINDVSNYTAGNKYSCFIGGDNAYTEIENPTITDGSACLLYKDSYGNPFATFLVNNYQTVYIIDSRYFTVNLKEFVTSHVVQDVIFLNNLESISEATVQNLSAQIQ